MRDLSVLRDYERKGNTVILSAIIRRTAMAGAAVAVATLGLGATQASATQVVNFPGSTGGFTYNYYGTYAEFYTGQGGLQSIIRVTGNGSAQDRAQCQRGNGETNWYQSTIRASGGGTSHYDCSANGTYNRALVGVGADF
ncbi:hypothetical protein [Kitasatospora sp. NPDC091207]|uniref:hypothetical protein n=1 Tax=Kitasatospora sp. NPDC091207 TaxID=3364083 RepID=UPI00381C0C51